MFQNVSEQVNEQKSNEINLKQIKLICKDIFKI